MIGLGVAELLVIVVIGGMILSMFGFMSFAAITSLFPRGPGPRLLGLCWRLSQQHDLPVGGLRFLVAMATILTGIFPGIVAYVVFALLNHSDVATERRPPVNGVSSGRDDPFLLGICSDVARRLGVPARNVGMLFVAATLLTGILPGVIAYLAAGLVKTYVGPEKWSEWLGDPPRASASVAPSWQGAAVPPGRIGRYRIVGLLGRGGMGSVWRGRDDALGRDAAVKVIDGPFGSEAVRRFGEEARAAAALASPHIVQIWEYAPESRPPFLAMEYVAGKSVLELVRFGGPQPPATAIDCARQVLAGLATAHAAGIVHRDIKPANILLATSGPSAGTYKLTDFGLARSNDRGQALTATGTLLGTLSYLAPEVAIGDDATPSSDLYALGATLHEMLVGRPPLSAESPLKLLRKITTESIPPIGTLRADLPADVAAWIDRLVARDPLARFPSAEGARAALDAIDGTARATTDLELVRTARSADAVPWHRRPAPGFPNAGSPPPLPPVLPADRLPDVLGRAMAFEADGRDALGEDSILDIARELNVDPAAVRDALLQSRQGRGEGVTQVFRRALGGEAQAERWPDRSRSDIFAKAWIPGRPGTDWTWRSTIVTACVAAFIAGLVGMTIIKVAREGAARTESEAARAAVRRVAEEILESRKRAAKAAGTPAEAEAPAAISFPPQPAESPEATPPAGVLRFTLAPRAAIPTSMAVLFLVAALAGAGFARGRRLTRAADRKWP